MPKMLGLGRLHSCQRFLEDDSEQPPLVEASEIRAERFGLANDGLVTGESLGKRAETPIGIDIVHYDCATRS
jgi:hypothetical protein